MTGALRAWLSAGRIRSLILAAALVCAFGTGCSPAGRWLDRAIAPLRFASAMRPASGRVVIVEMDAASVAAIRRWPWSREHHGAVVDRLRAAGAASVTFDVDFSSASTPAGDAAFAQALRRAQGLVALATFAQAASARDVRSVDALPLPAFRPHVALGSVSIAPDADGIVRQAVYGTMTAGTPRPSLSALIAHRSGTADSFFPVAFEIDPGTIPRLSFVAVRDGRFDPAAVRGRDVLIGATAVEMGDRYATPLWGVVPGVVVQALAAETLLPGIPGEVSTLPSLAAALLTGWAVLRARRLAMALAVAAAGGVLLFAGVVWAHAAWQQWAPLVPGLVLLGLVVLARAAIHLHARFDDQRLHDHLTGLPNRRAMVRPDGGGAGAGGGLGGGGGALAVVLLANLEPLLAVLGEGAERDLVLRLADRLNVVSGGAAIHRLSDRLLAFAVGADDHLDALPGRLRAVLLQPVEVQGRRVDPAVHLGMAAGDAPVGDRLTMAAHAAEEAATAGAFWRAGVTDRAALERSVSLMGELDHAISAGEIEVHYQPKLSLAQDRIVAVEALVRWRHPARGMIAPDLFIPIAEQADRIGPLTQHVLAQVVEDMVCWHAAGLAIGAAVNVSAKLVADEEFGAGLRALLSSSRVDPRDLTLEVTESATLSDPERAAAALRGYRTLGCGVSMDDYGTGHSTLSYLQRLPLTELKIDRSFVQHAHLSADDALMVRSTIDLAHGLGLKVVAEGIEDEGCLAFLRDAGCDLAQGYFIGRPMPSARLMAALVEDRQAA